MKRIIIYTLIAFLNTGMGFVQERFDMATFTVPTGWQMAGTGETVTLQPAPQKGVTCQIIISATEKRAVITAAEYLQYRAAKSGKGISYDNNKGAVSKYEAGGLVSFFSKGSVTGGKTPVHSYFYSLSNGNQTFYYQLLTSNNDCIDEFNQFMTALKMDVEDEGSEKAKKPTAKKRRATAPAPAAPAPIM